MDLAALRSALPDVLDRAAADWQALGDRLGTQVAAMRSEVTQPLFGSGAWVGRAADAADANLNNLAKQLGITQDDTSTMTVLLRDAAAGVRDAQSLLLAAENLAAQNRLTIGPDGSVSAAPASPLVGSLSAPLLGEALPPAAGEVADLVRRALAVASDVDAQITARLRELQRFTGTSSAAASELRSADRLASAFDRAMLPSEGASPVEVNAWWKALAPGQQQRLIHEFPSQVGWMDGVPATARDQANRLGLSQEGAQLKTQLASLQGNEPPQYLGEGRFGPTPNTAWQQWQGQISGIETKLAGITSIEQALSIGGRNGYPPAYLLGFNTAGNGRAIVSFGNPDTASNVVTYVPGLGSKITGAPGDSGRAAALWQQANRFAPEQATASVYWLGYNAPQLGLSQGIHNLDVTSTADAVTGGQALAHFETGLQATHQPGIPGHTVVLGHSYGSLVVGEAAAHDGLHTGDIIFVGSPGVSVNNVAQLGMSSAHVWAGANVHDPVPQLPPFNPFTALGNDNAGHFGNNPATSAFGGQVFNASHDPSRSFSGLDLSAHSAYWDANSDSLKNMARIVDGQYSGVTLQDPPALSPLPDPGPIVGPGVI